LFQPLLVLVSRALVPIKLYKVVFPLWHSEHYASARARRQAPEVPGPLREAPNYKYTGGLCHLAI
jgi:hypothetical protein